MKQTHSFKYAVKCLILGFLCVVISAYTYLPKKHKVISMVPALTEIVFAIDGQESLIGVSSRCNYPVAAAKKSVVGDTFFINKERIIRMRPEYIFALDSQKPILDDLKNVGIKVVYFRFKDISDVYSGINMAGSILNKTQKARLLVQALQDKIERIKPEKRRSIFYVVQTDPLITIGNKSFINDIITKSGHKSITSGINAEYPKISAEFVLKSNPDIIVSNVYSNKAVLKKLFPKSRIVELTYQQVDIINRPSPRIYKSVEFFSKL